MLNSKHREDWRPERPLPAFGSTSPGVTNERGSLLHAIDAEASWQDEDAAARHRRARLMRETWQDRSPSPAEDIAHEPSDPNDFEDAGFYADLSQAEWPWPEDSALAGEAVASATTQPETPVPAAGESPRIGVARSKRLIAACGLLGAAAGGLVALSLPTRYEATAEVQLAAAATGAGIEDQVRIATSGIVINKVVDKLGLADDPDFNGAATDGGLIGLARALILRSDGAAASDAGQRHALAASRLADSLTTRRGSGPAAIAITADTGNGEKSALIANTVADAFLDTAAAMQSTPAAKTAGPATDGAAHKLDVFLANHGLTSANGLAAADALLKLDDQRTAARARTADINGKIAEMRTLGADAGGLPQEFESGAMGELRRQYLAIKRESDRAAAQLGPRNPERIALDTQLSGARDRIAAELRRIVTSLQGELKEAVQAEQALASRLAQTKLADDDIATLRTLRDAAGNAEARSTEQPGAEIAAPPNGGMRIVAKAYAPQEPSGPPRLAITLAGLLLGIGAGFGLSAGRGRRETADDTGEDRAPTIRMASAGNPPDVEAVVATVRQAMPARDPIDAGGAELSSSEPAESPSFLETAMYPVYPDQMSPFAAPQPGDYPRQPYPPYPYAAQPVMPMPMGVPYVYTPYAPAHLWQAQQAVPLGYYPYPQPPYGPRMAAYPQQAPAEAAQNITTADRASMEEIRASLREFREAVRELAESRSRRRSF
ncbi:MAG: hypothetical protein J0I98_23540 [Mesorhizobium sp.]|nr:hypothetical protein [Mesorhizobium sp.]MBN9245749.1 hypothetical protein [Mesorhizobium sp.]